MKPKEYYFVQLIKYEEIFNINNKYEGDDDSDNTYLSTTITYSLSLVLAANFQNFQ